MADNKKSKPGRKKGGSRTLKKGGDTVPFRMKLDENQAIIDFVNAQSNFTDTIRYLIEEEIKRNGIRNLQRIIPPERDFLVGEQQVYSHSQPGYQEYMNNTKAAIFYKQDTVKSDEYLSQEIMGDTFNKNIFTQQEDEWEPANIPEVHEADFSLVDKTPTNEKIEDIHEDEKNDNEMNNENIKVTFGGKTLKTRTVPLHTSIQKNRPKEKKVNQGVNIETFKNQWTF